MDFSKVDLTEVVDAMAQAALDKGEGEGVWEQSTPLQKQEARQIMLTLLLPGADVLEGVIRSVIAEEIRDRAKFLNPIGDQYAGLMDAAMIAEGSVSDD